MPDKGSWIVRIATNEGEKTTKIDDKTRKSITIDTSSDKAWEHSSKRLATFVKEKFGDEVKVEGNPTFEEAHKDNGQMDLFESANTTGTPAPA